MAIYSYTISTSFLNGTVDCAKLEQEIDDNVVIVTTVEYTTSDVDSDTFKISFQGTPSSAELTELDSVMAAHDGIPTPPQSSELLSFLDANAIVVDPTTSIYGPFNLMQIMINRREIFNDVDSPLYISGFIPLNTAVATLNSIHAKTGWHYREIQRLTYKCPKDVLFYYGYPNSYNSSTNSWNNELVAQDMARYGLIVLGDGVQDPGHADYANLLIIVARVKVIRPDTVIFGYVSSDQSQANFTTKAGQWDTVGVHGIFMDESGYDFGVTRQTFNTYVDIVHSQTTANLVFANSWNINHVLGTDNDPTYPNTTYNPTEVESNLTSSDYYLLESFAVNTLVYTASTPVGYEPIADYQYRVAAMCNKRDTYGVNMVGVAVIDDSHAQGQNLFDFAYTASLMAALDAFSSSSHYYGASSAQVAWWTRPDCESLGEIYRMYPSIVVDGTDSDVLLRITERARMTLDFSSSAQTSSIVKY